MAMSAVLVTGEVVRQEWTDKEGPSPAVLVTVRLTALAAHDFAAIVAARALKGMDVALVELTEGDDADDVEALLNP
jgi:hypothetical protein